MSILSTILDRTHSLSAEGALPVVILDLDSTLFDTGERHRRILAEFAADHGDPAFRALVDSLGPADFGWSVLQPLTRAGFDDPALHKQVMKHWGRCFFSDRYADVDLPVRGAVPYVHALADAGALCVYLTGRDAPGMGAATLRLLHRRGLPILDGRGLALLKPSTRAQDADHKRSALAQVRRLGTVVASFENEPAHASTFRDAFPDAHHVLVGDIHSPDAPAPHPAIHPVLDFRGPWERPV